MARISRTEREANKRMYDAVIYQIFVTEGWEAITFDRLAKELNVRKSTLQGYYPSRGHFVSAVQGKILPMVLQFLDISSKDNFIHSWNQALHDNPQFATIIKMFIGNALQTDTSNITRQALSHLQRQLQQNMSRDDAELAIKISIGDSILVFSTY